MRLGDRQFVWLGIVVTLLVVAEPVHGQLWKPFIPSSRSTDTQSPRIATATQTNRDRAGGAQGQPLADNGNGDYTLKQDSGPWLIVAASFSGNGAETQAQQLAQELRERFKLRAYVHEMDFKFGGDSTGPNSLAQTRRHYRHGDQVRELAVLVGDFTSINGPDAQQMLTRIKTLEPNALNVDPNQSAQSMAQVHRLEDALMEKLGKPRKHGPMGQAFFTRNPLLPREYFVPKGVDAFVAKMNEGVEHSLLDCPGRQTIQVATFRGKTVLQASAQEDATTKSFFSLKKRDETNPLVEAAENAHLLTRELRAHGFEAYEFHNRTESIVTIGAFDQATQQLPDGRTIVIPQVQRIIQTFDASYDTPADPLSPIGNDSQNLRLVQEQQQQVGMKLSSQQAQMVPGLNPKHVKILHGRGRNVKVDRIIPIDVHPQVIDVPKRSISSAYSS